VEKNKYNIRKNSRKYIPQAYFIQQANGLIKNLLNRSGRLSGSICINIYFREWRHFV